MATPHNEANVGTIAKTVLMAGDPLRAKYIAENFLEEPMLFNQVRGMLGYTGKFHGKEISVMGHGMGTGSIGIYSYELFHFYDVENIIRIGSAGSYSEKLKLYDVVLVQAAISESTFAKTMSNYQEDTTFPDAEMCKKIEHAAATLHMSVTKAAVHCSDVFYRTTKETTPVYWEKLRDERNCLAVETESFALFHVAAELGKRAACMLTISDSFVSSEKTTVQERQLGFNNMMKIALKAALEQ